MSSVTDAARWFFFAEYPWSPFPLLGLVACGWVARGWLDRWRGRE